MKDSIDRIAVALERIADALEKQDKSTRLPIDQPWDYSWPMGPCTLDPKEWQWTGPTADAVSDKWLDTQKPYDAEIKYSTGTTHLRQRFGVDYSVMGDGDA